VLVKTSVGAVVSQTSTAAHDGGLTKNDLVAHDGYKGTSIGYQQLLVTNLQDQFIGIFFAEPTSITILFEAKLKNIVCDRQTMVIINNILFIIFIFFCK